MSKLASGDKIKHKVSGADYIVISVNPYNDSFLAKRDADGLEIDFSLKHFDKIFESIEELPMGYGLDWSGLSRDDIKLQPKCECGVDSLGAGLHSGYCPKRSSNV
jgi:hypothetical protein